MPHYFLLFNNSFSSNLACFGVLICSPFVTTRDRLWICCRFLLLYLRNITKIRIWCRFCLISFLTLQKIGLFLLLQHLLINIPYLINLLCSCSISVTFLFIYYQNALNIYCIKNKEITTWSVYLSKLVYKLTENL